MAVGSGPQHANVSWLHDSVSAASAAASGLSQALPVSGQLLGVTARPRPVLDADTKYYLTVLLCIAAANSVFTFVRAFSFAYGGLIAARKLHDQLLTAVINAPAKFFQVTLLGENQLLTVIPCHQMQACILGVVNVPKFLVVDICCNPAFQMLVPILSLC